MKTLPAELILKKNALNVKGPWIWLFELAVDDSTTWRISSYTENITWNSLPWIGTACGIEVITDDLSGRFDTVSLTIANVNQEVSAYVEADTIVGRGVTVRLVHSEHLSVVTNVPTFHWRVNAADITAEGVTFELGFEDLLSINFPWQRFFRDHCRHVFKDAYCAYLQEEFAGDTEQVFDTGVDGTYVYNQGWKVANRAYAARNASDVLIFDSNVTAEDNLTIKVLAGSVYRWWGGSMDGPFLYREFSANFDVSCHYTGTIGTYDSAFLVVQGYSDLDDYLTLGARYSGGIEETYYSFADGAGAATQIRTAPIRNYWRIAKTGTAFALYDKAKEADDWSLINTLTRADLGSTVKVGLSVGCLATSGATAQTFDWIRWASGGNLVCDYTLYGTAGCVAQGNSRHFGAFPTIPYGPLVGI